MRRILLGPVIVCVMIAGLIGADSGQVAYARTNGNKESKALSEESEKRRVPDCGLASRQTSDLRLARDCPDVCRGLAQEENPACVIEKIIESAYGCIGVPYRRGGTTPKGFDCSGFVRYVFGENGISLSRSSREQALEGKPVELSDIRPGDLLFFKMRQQRKSHTPIDHVGLYLGDGKFIHASNNPRTGEIKVDNLEAPHYLPKVVEARRVVDTVR